MNFYYDPILGLVYNTLESVDIVNDIITINMDAIPKVFSLERWISLLTGAGIMFVDSKNEIHEPIIITTNRL